MKSVTAKLGNMRKAQPFTVYPPQSDGTIVVQSDKQIGQFDPKTGQGVFNNANRPAYFHHLMPGLGAKPYTFPAEFVQQCVEAAPKKGDTIGGIVTIG